MFFPEFADTRPFRNKIVWGVRLSFAWSVKVVPPPNKRPRGFSVGRTDAAQLGAEECLGFYGLLLESDTQEFGLKFQVYNTQHVDDYDAL